MVPLSLRIIIVFVVCTLWLPVMAAGDVITIRADEWCPYNCEPHSDAPGFMVEIAIRIFEEKGHTVDYAIMPWARAIQDTRKGKYNAIIGAGKEDAPDFVYPDIEQAQMVNVFYVKAGVPWTYQGVASFAGKVLGVIKDYTYIEEIDTYINENTKNSKQVQIVPNPS